MSQDELAAFLAIVDRGSLSAAAEALYLSQPTLSARLKSLESRLGYPLILRKKGCRALTLTESGMRFLPVARKAQALWEEAKTLSAAGTPGTLRVAAVSSVSSFVLPTALEEYLRRDPLRRISAATCHYDDGYRLVEEGKADIAFICPELHSETVSTWPAYRSAMVCVLAGTEPPPGAVPLSSLDPSAEIYVPWSFRFRDWHDARLSPELQPYAAVDNMTILGSILHGGHWAIVPELVAQRFAGSGVHVRPLEDPPPDQFVFYLTRSDRPSDSAKEFLRCLHRALQALGGAESFLGGL